MGLITGRDDAILMNYSTASLIDVRVDDQSLTADENGEKVLYAGTLLTADSDAIVDDETASTVMKPTTDASTAQAILLHDTDVAKEHYVSAIIGGDINKYLMEDSVKTTYYSNDNVKALKQSLPSVVVRNRY